MKTDDQKSYLDWSVRSFRLSTAGAQDAAQIRTHLCYSEFGVVIDAITALDADVTSIEAARSRGDVIDDIRDAAFPHGVGPGVWDIHSPCSLDRGAAGHPAARRRRAAAQAGVGEPRLWAQDPRLRRDGRVAAQPRDRHEECARLDRRVSRTRRSAPEPSWFRGRSSLEALIRPCYGAHAGRIRHASAGAGGSLSKGDDMRRRMQTGVLVGVVALMLAGCTGTATSTETAKPEAAASVSASESTSDGDEVVIDEDSGLTAADITKLGDPVATAEIPAFVDGDPAATMTVNLYGLKRDGKTVVGTYSFTVNTTAPDRRPSACSPSSAT